jgi:MFS family permease
VRRRLLALAALMAIRATGSFQLQAVASAAPALLVALGLSYAELGMLMGAFMVSGVFVAVPAGLLARRIGDRPVLYGGLALMAVGGALAGIANSFMLVLLARVISGVGGVAVLMLVIKMVTDRFSGAMLSTATSMEIDSWPAGMAASLVVMGPLAASGADGWRWAFALSGLPALLALALVPMTGEPHEAVHPRTAAAAALPAPGWRMVAAASLCWALLNAGIAVMAGFLPDYLIATGMADAPAANFASLASWAFAAATPFGGLVADRWVGRRLAVIGGAVITGLLFAAVVGSGGNGVVVLLLGASFALSPGALTAQVGEATPPAFRASVFGWYSGGSYLALAIAPWVAGWLRDATASAAAPMWFGAVLMLAMWPAYLWFRRSVMR